MQQEQNNKSRRKYLLSLLYTLKDYSEEEYEKAEEGLLVHA